LDSSRLATCWRGIVRLSFSLRGRALSCASFRRKPGVSFTGFTLACARGTLRPGENDQSRVLTRLFNVVDCPSHESTDDRGRLGGAFFLSNSIADVGDGPVVDSSLSRYCLSILFPIKTLRTFGFFPFPKRMCSSALDRGLSTGRPTPRPASFQTLVDFNSWLVTRK
jgi:hypothetical protein